MAATSNKSNQVAKCDGSVLPHLESWERMMKLPVVEAAWDQSQGVYNKVKDFSPMFNWAFRTTENVVKGCVNLSAPIVHKFDTPINFVDQTFVKGLDKLEATAPIIKEPPAEILNQAKAKVMDVVQPQLDKLKKFWLHLMDQYVLLGSIRQLFSPSVFSTVSSLKPKKIM